MVIIQYMILTQESMYRVCVCVYIISLFSRTIAQVLICDMDNEPPTWSFHALGWILVMDVLWLSPKNVRSKATHEKDSASGGGGRSVLFFSSPAPKSQVDDSKPGREREVKSSGKGEQKPQLGKEKKQQQQQKKKNKKMKTRTTTTTTNGREVDLAVFNTFEALLGKVRVVG